MYLLQAQLKAAAAYKARADDAEAHAQVRSAALRAALGSTYKYTAGARMRTSHACDSARSTGADAGLDGRQALKESEARLNGTMMRLEAELGIACDEVTYLKHQLVLKVRSHVR